MQLENQKNNKTMSKKLHDLEERVNELEDILAVKIKEQDENLNKLTENLTKALPDIIKNKINETLLSYNLIKKNNE